MSGKRAAPPALSAMVDNAFIEAFNGRFRAECLNAHWFLTLPTPAKSWRIGASTTTRIGRTGPSATRPRFTS